MPNSSINVRKTHYDQKSNTTPNTTSQDYVFKSFTWAIQVLDIYCSMKCSLVNSSSFMHTSMVLASRGLWLIWTFAYFNIGVLGVTTWLEIALAMVLETVVCAVRKAGSHIFVCLQEYCMWHFWRKWRFYINMKKLVIAIMFRFWSS